MSVIRVEKTDDYTIMSNSHLKERTMSLKAKGLLSLMLSLPDDWDYTIAGLATICKENETAIKSTLKELKKFGYLEIIKIAPSKETCGRITYDYIVHETPVTFKIQEGEKQGVENQPLEIQPVEVLAVENQGQLNTNILNTNNKCKKEIKKKKQNENTKIDLEKRTKDKVKKKYKYFGEYGNVFLTDEQYEKLKNEFPNDYQARIKDLDFYIQSYGKKYKDCLATIRNWARKDSATLKKYNTPKTEPNKKDPNKKAVDTSRLTDEEYTALIRNETTIEELIEKGKVDVL